MGKVIYWIKSLFGLRKGKEKNESLGSNGSSNLTKKEESKQTPTVVSTVSSTVAGGRMASHVSITSLFLHTLYELAALKIQSTYRGYLGRRVLKALRGVMKIQALVRSMLVRKQISATLHGMEALIRAQNNVRAKQFNQNFHVRKLKGHTNNKSNEYIPTIHSRRMSSSFETGMKPFDEKPMADRMGLNPVLARPKLRPSRSRNSIFDSRDVRSILADCNNSGRLPEPNTGNFSRWASTCDDNQLSITHSIHCFPHQSSQFGNGPNGLIKPKRVCTGSDNFPKYLTDTHSFRAKVRGRSVLRQRPNTGLKTRGSLVGGLTENRSIHNGTRMEKSGPHAQDVVAFKKDMMRSLR